MQALSKNNFLDAFNVTVTKSIQVAELECHTQKKEFLNAMILLFTNKTK